MSKPLLIIVGPTAVGKTELSISLAHQLNGEIISADSMQVYKYMNVGSAKPSIEEQQGIPHFLIDEMDPRENFSVAQFQKKAKQYINRILEKDKLPMVVGGTGLYINSIIYDLDFTETVSNWELRKKLQMEAETYGNYYLHKKLEKIDPKTASRIHPNNIKRIIRALEVFYESGETMKDFKNALVENKAYQYAMIGLIRDREELYERINSRVDRLIEKGLVAEVNHLMNLGLDETDISMKGLGYKEIIKYLKGIYSLEEAIHLLKRNTRRYAKRQITWFKRYHKIKWFNISHYDSTNQLEYDILKYIEGELTLI